MMVPIIAGGAPAVEEGGVGGGGFGSLRQSHVYQPNCSTFTPTVNSLVVKLIPP